MAIGDWFKNIGGKLGQASEFFQSPEGRMLMAGVGTGLDPKGAGGAIGQPVMEMLRTKSLKKGITERRASEEKWRTQLLNLLGGKITAPGKPGLDNASFKVDDQGRVRMSSVEDLGIMEMGDLEAPTEPPEKKQDEALPMIGGRPGIPGWEDLWR